MQFEKEEVSMQILDRLAEYGIFISNNAPPLNKEKALVLLGEAMLNKFVSEFVSLWENELFPKQEMTRFLWRSWLKLPRTKE